LEAGIVGSAEQAGIPGIPGVSLTLPRQANAVFAKMPAAMSAGLRARGWAFYDFIGSGGARLMCAWDTSEGDVDALLADMRELAQSID
jgi:threonine aldolase